MSLSTIVVALNAQLLRRVDLGRSAKSSTWAGSFASVKMRRRSASSSVPRSSAARASHGGLLEQREAL